MCSIYFLFSKDSDTILKVFFFFMDEFAMYKDLVIN